VGLPHFGQNLTPASITEPQELQNAINHLTRAEGLRPRSIPQSGKGI